MILGKKCDLDDAQVVSTERRWQVRVSSCMIIWSVDTCTCTYLYLYEYLPVPVWVPACTHTLLMMVCACAGYSVWGWEKPFSLLLNLTCVCVPLRYCICTPEHFTYSTSSKTLANPNSLGSGLVRIITGYKKNSEFWAKWRTEQQFMPPFCTVILMNSKKIDCKHSFSL